MFFKRADDSATTTTATDEISVSETKPAAEPKGTPNAHPQGGRSGAQGSPQRWPTSGASKKEQRIAARTAAQQDRAKAREGMLKGDERYLPARDRGPVRKFVRDYVDSRRTVAEFFVPVAVVVLLLGLMREARLQAFVTLVWLLILVVVAVDTTVMLVRLNNQLKAQWPDKAERKGVNLYAVMRGLQIRRLRVPPPMYKAGGRPVEPKQPK